MKIVFILALLVLTLIKSHIIGADTLLSDNARVIDTPLVDLIINPWRYEDRIVKTRGFITKGDGDSWMLVLSADNCKHFDFFSMVHLDTKRVINGQQDRMSNAFVTIYGKFRSNSKERQYPGEVFKIIDVTRITIIGQSINEYYEIEMQPN